MSNMTAHQLARALLALPDGLVQLKFTLKDYIHYTGVTQVSEGGGIIMVSDDGIYDAGEGDNDAETF